MNIQNMTQENVDFFKKHLEKMKNGNENLTYSVYPMMNGESESDKLKKILDKLEKIERKIENIFGDQVFIDGKMIDIKNGGN